MKTKELNAKVFPYILDNISSEDKELKTDQEKLQYVYDTFLAEKWTVEKRNYYNNMHNGFNDWLTGLPSCFSIDFTTHRILKIAVLWGSISENANEREREKILNNWFNLITCKTFQLFRKYKIT